MKTWEKTATEKYLEAMRYEVITEDEAGVFQFVAKDTEDDCVVFIRVKGVECTSKFDANSFPEFRWNQKTREELESAAIRWYISRKDTIDMLIGQFRFDDIGIIRTVSGAALVQHHENAGGNGC